MVEYSSNQTLPYIGVTNKKLLLFVWNEQHASHKKMKPETKYKHKKPDDFEILEHMELSFLWATDPNFLLSRNFGHLYRRARD